MRHFSRSHGSSFTQNFVNFSGKKRPSIHFALLRDVILGIALGGVYGLYLDSETHLFSLKRFNYAPFLEVARIAIFAWGTLLSAVNAEHRTTRPLSSVSGPPCFGLLLLFCSFSKNHKNHKKTKSQVCWGYFGWFIGVILAGLLGSFWLVYW